MHYNFILTTSVSYNITEILQSIGVTFIHSSLSSVNGGDMIMPNVFWEYVHSPSRVGVLMTIDFLLRNEHSNNDKNRGNLKNTTTIITNEQNNNDFNNKNKNIMSSSNIFSHLCIIQLQELKSFLINIESIPVMTDKECEIIRSLPIFVCFEQNNNNSESNQRYVAINNRSLTIKPLSKSSFRNGDNDNNNNDDDDDDTSNNNFYFQESPLSIPFMTITSFHHISDSLLPPNIIKYSTTIELQLLKQLKVQVLTLAEYYRYIFLPNLFYLYTIHRLDVENCLLHMILTLKDIIKEDTSKDFVIYLKTIPFVPSKTNILNRIQQIFDPTVMELSILLGSESFPCELFQRPDVLIVLKTLGMKTTLDWKGILSCASSIAAMEDYQIPALTIIDHTSNIPTTNSSSSSVTPFSSQQKHHQQQQQLNQVKALRASSLLSFLDKNLYQYINSRASSTTTSSASTAIPTPRDNKDNKSMKTSGSFRLFNFFTSSSSPSKSSSSSSKSPSSINDNQYDSYNSRVDDDVADDNAIDATSISDYVDVLKTIPWIPVITTPFHVFLPWPTNDNHKYDDAKSSSSSSRSYNYEKNEMNDSGGSDNDIHQSRQSISLSLYAAPIDVASREDAWLCSFSKRLVAQTVTQGRSSS